MPCGPFGLVPRFRPTLVATARARVAALARVVASVGSLASVGFLASLASLGSLTSVAFAALAAPAALTAIVVVAGCSASDSPCGSPCAAGTECLDDGSGHRSCQTVCTRQDQCPHGWYCNDGQPKSWCAQMTTDFGPAKAGQFAAPCLPSGGEINPSCDTDDVFGCYGASPTDANAFCTYFDCMVDADCPGGWWCATIDRAPNVSSASRSFGSPRTVCLPRGYCAPCRMDHDCPVAADGTTQQHCARDATGAGFCSPQCASDDQCPLDATCQPSPWGVCAPAACQVDADCAGPAGQRCSSGTCRAPCSTSADCPAANGAPQRCDQGVCAPRACASDDDCPPSAAGIFEHCNQGSCAPECGSAADCDRDQTCSALATCMPRAGVCVGDGRFCSPCRSDADCAPGGGYCLDAVDSTERFCSQPVAAGSTCSTAASIASICPAVPRGASSRAVTCTTTSSDFAPAGQCVGEVTFAGQPVPGCWTVNR
ncbi:MAG TPA: hypothetical protein VE987_18525 [Polyangiaceae bacterium]|nr:hypothetical protein [Polyangiaceae bacterium]